MKDSKKAYKNYLPKLKKDDKSKFRNKLYLSLMSKNKNKFWTSWKNKVGNQSEPPRIIDGQSCNKDIANSFAATAAKKNLTTPQTLILIQKKSF